MSSTPCTNPASRPRSSPNRIRAVCSHGTIAGAPASHSSSNLVLPSRPRSFHASKLPGCGSGRNEDGVGSGRRSGGGNSERRRKRPSSERVSCLQRPRCRFGAARKLERRSGDQIAPRAEASSCTDLPCKAERFARLPIATLPAALARDLDPPNLHLLTRHRFTHIPHRQRPHLGNLLSPPRPARPPDRSDRGVCRPDGGRDGGAPNPIATLPAALARDLDPPNLHLLTRHRFTHIPHLLSPPRPARPPDRSDRGVCRPDGGRDGGADGGECPWCDLVSGTAFKFPRCSEPNRHSSRRSCP
jgi:hypothetical protein